MAGSLVKPLELGPCPECGVPASQFDIGREERPVGDITEITCRNCGYSNAQLIVAEREQDRC
jgi:rubredoxin